MPHVSGHTEPTTRPKIRPKKVPPIKPRVRPSTVKQDAFPVPRQGGGGGPKGGGPAKIDPTTEAGQSFVQKYNNDGRFGYYNTNPNHEKYALGEYVPAFRDMFDGGGADYNDTFFKGAGPISTLLNVGKIRPYGQSQTPREQIGFRDFNDMFDRGGPQHSGGKFEGGGTISMMGNLMDKLSGREETPKTRYYEGPASVGLMVPNEATPAPVTSPEVALSRFEQPDARATRASYSGGMVRRPVRVSYTDDELGLPGVPVDQGVVEVGPVTPIMPNTGFDAYGVRYGDFSGMESPTVGNVEVGGNVVDTMTGQTFTEAERTVMELMGEQEFMDLTPDMRKDVIERFMALRGGTDLQ